MSVGLIVSNTTHEYEYLGRLDIICFSMDCLLIDEKMA
jgi:hypothetical protein